MKEEVNKKLLEYVERTDAFLTDQVPDYISQLLKYYKIKHTVYIVVCLLFIGLSAYLVQKGIDVPRKEYGWNKGDITHQEILCYVAAGAIMIYPCTELVPNILRLFKLKIAPKVFIIEHIKGR